MWWHTRATFFEIFGQSEMIVYNLILLRGTNRTFSLDILKKIPFYDGIFEGKIWLWKCFKVTNKLLVNFRYSIENSRKWTTARS